MVNFTNQILYLSSDKEIVSNPTWFKIISKTRIPPRSSMKLNKGKISTPFLKIFFVLRSYTSIG